MNIAQCILAAGADSASAVLYGETSMTHGELRRQATETAWTLLGRGHHKGDRIGILSENSPFFVVSYLGTILAGLVAVPVQTEISEEAFAGLVSEAGIRTVLASKRYCGRARLWGQKAGVEVLEESAGDQSCGVRGQKACAEIDSATDLAALMFTSGSTGAPKGVMISHRNIECNSRDIINYMELSSGDRAMAVLPFHYCFGLSLLHTLLMAGASIVLNNQFRLYPETVLREMRQKECTGFAGVPSTYQLLLRKSRFRTLEFPKLRWLQQAGGKLPNACIVEIRAAFPQVRYFLMYGQTEATARLSYLPPHLLGSKLGSVGKGLPSTRLEVLKADGTRVAPGSAETGEVVAQGDNIALGYWNDPAETSKFFENGKLHTGDIARVDSEGFIFIIERERDMIKCGGNRVSSKEVEEAIAEIQEVVEVAAVGVPHDLLGEAIKAFVVVVPKTAIGARDIEVHCRKRLAPYKVPQEIILLPSMPHNEAGKVLKVKLKEMLVSQLQPSMAGGRQINKTKGNDKGYELQQRG